MSSCLPTFTALYFMSRLNHICLSMPLTTFVNSRAANYASFVNGGCQHVSRKYFKVKHAMIDGADFGSQLVIRS